ncbi:MAG: hypothetical protein ACM3YE_04600 [Bacteroidota bacterium]
MNLKKILLGVLMLVLSIAVIGCNWFTDNQTRPAPVRPRNPTPTRNINPAPTKRTPGASALTEKQLLDRINRIEAAAKKGDWSVCNRETNLLGVDMTRYRPSTTNGKSLRNIGTFDAAYAKLQADAKSKNRPAVIRNCDKLRDDLKRIKNNPKT